MEHGVRHREKDRAKNGSVKLYGNIITDHTAMYQHFLN